MTSQSKFLELYAFKKFNLASVFFLNGLKLQASMSMSYLYRF